MTTEPYWQQVAADLGYAREADMWHALYVGRRLSIGDLATRFSVGVKTIKRHLRAAGIPLRSRGGPNCVKIHDPDAMRAEIEIDGVTAVAERHGLSRTALYKRCYYAVGLRPPQARARGT